MPTPPANQTFSTFQIGTWNPATDTWTLLYDLNQPVTGPVWVMNKYPQWSPGEKYDSRSTTIRAVGERIVETNLKNGHWKVKISIRGSSTSAIAAIVRSISQALEQEQLCIRYAAPGASLYLYFDVRKTTHNLHQAPAQQIIAGIQSGLIDFECFPCARGDRITLQNLVMNPGFEQPSGPAVQVFTDSFANTDAYTVAAGTGPSITSQLMTVPSGTTLLFGSPVWGAINSWFCRFQMASSMSSEFGLHFTNGSNLLWVAIASTGTFALNHTIGGTTHTLASSAQTYTATNFYWLQVVQFPTLAGNKPFITVNLYNDSSGSVGTLKASISSETFDAVTALVGQMSLVCFSGTMKVGGANTSNSVALFSPGGWTFNGYNGQPAANSGAIDGSAAGAPTSVNTNSFSGGPVQCYAAARIDLAPSGVTSAFWTNFAGGVAPNGTASIPVTAPGNVMAASCWVKSSGLGANAQIFLIANEYNASGSQLRFTTLGTLTGNQSSWIQISNFWTTGANCVSVGLNLRVDDTTGGSSSGTVWFENTQCYNQTITGQTSMPYCELRFPQSPCQMLISGLLGDAPAPIYLTFGTYVGTLNTGHSLSFGVGRKATTGFAAVLTSPPYSADTLVSTALASTSYGGQYVSQPAVINSFIAPTLGVVSPMPDSMGIYHFIALMQTADATTTNVQVQMVSAQQDPGNINTSGLSTSVGGLFTPFTAQNTWTVVDLGLVSIPNFPVNAAAAQTNFPWSTWAQIDDTGTTATHILGWALLLPYDAERLLGTVTNPSGYTNLSSQYLWFYNEALTLSQKTLFPQSWQTQAIGTTLNVANSALAQAQYAVGGPGPTTGSFLEINPTGSSFMMVDPTQVTVNSSNLGVNQFGAFIADDVGTVLPWISEIAYSPYYYYQR